MRKAKLLDINEDRELSLSSEGMSLAERVGVDVFI